MRHLLCQLSTRYVLRPPDENSVLRTAPLQLPILYVVRSLVLSTAVIRKPLIDPQHPDCRLRLRHLRCVEHTGGL